MSKKKTLLIAAALLMLSVVAVKPAMAYLTDTHSTNGGAAVYLEDRRIEIIPKERIEENTKVISVENTGDLPVFVRVKVIAGRTHLLELDTEKSDSRWSYNEDDGYYYYSDILEVEETSKELYVKIAPGNSAEEKFNVIVVAEAARPLSDGSAGDWKGKIAQETNTYDPAQNEGGN